ncbi:MAG: hypothetical protein ACTHMG_05850 [Sphingomonas sp.]
MRIPSVVALSVMLACAPAAARQAASDVPSGGTISVELAGNPSPADRPFADAVQQALPDAGFLALPAPSHSRYIAEVTVTRHQRGKVAAGVEVPPATAGGGAIGVTLPSANTRLHGLVETTLTVRIKQRDDGHVVWSGSALTVRPEDTRAGDAAAIAPRLAAAVLQRYPAPSQGAITVP